MGLGEQLSAGAAAERLKALVAAGLLQAALGEPQAVELAEQPGPEAISGLQGLLADPVFS